MVKRATERSVVREKWSLTICIVPVNPGPHPVTRTADLQIRNERLKIPASAKIRRDLMDGREIMKPRLLCNKNILGGLHKLWRDLNNDHKGGWEPHRLGKVYLPKVTSTMVGILASGPSCPRFDSLCSRDFFSVKKIDVGAVNQQDWLEEKGPWLENGDRTHLVLQKIINWEPHRLGIGTWFSSKACKGLLSQAEPLFVRAVIAERESPGSIPNLP